jgi:hypothetical protein
MPPNLKLTCHCITSVTLSWSALTATCQPPHSTCMTASCCCAHTLPLRWPPCTVNRQDWQDDFIASPGGPQPPPRPYAVMFHPNYGETNLAPVRNPGDSNYQAEYAPGYHQIQHHHHHHHHSPVHQPQPQPQPCGPLYENSTYLGAQTQPYHDDTSFSSNLPTESESDSDYGGASTTFGFDFVNFDPAFYTHQYGSSGTTGPHDDDYPAPSWDMSARHSTSAVSLQNWPLPQVILQEEFNNDNQALYASDSEYLPDAALSSESAAAEGNSDDEFLYQHYVESISNDEVSPKAS